MGWNEPGKDEKDPWGGKKQPPDLEEAIKAMQAKLRKLFSGPTKRSSKSSSFKSNSNSNSNGQAVLVSLVMGAVLLLWVISGVFIVDPAEQAVVLRFGRYLKTVGPGPHWIPRFIESKVVLNVERVADYSYSAQMLTKDENLVSVAVAVQYRIGDLQDYLFNVTDAEESLQQATSSALRQVVGTTTLDQLITEGRDAWGSSVQDSLIKILDRYKTGIVIVNVSPQPARAPENVQDAFDDAIKAQEDEKRFKEQARAYEARVIPIAEGKAKRIDQEAKAFAEKVVLRAEGETAEFLALLPEYGRAPYVMQERMYLETMQNVLSRTTKIMVSNKSNNLLYLPLEQLMHSSQSTTSKIRPSVSVSRSTETSEQQDDNTVLDGRLVVRPTEQVGRDNS